MGIKKKFKKIFNKTLKIEHAEIAHDDADLEKPENSSKADLKEEKSLDKKKDEKSAEIEKIEDAGEDEPSQIEEIKEMFEHVIEPEERRIKNYLSPGFWFKKRDIYRQIREKEKEDMNIYQVLSEGAHPTIDYYILTILSCIISTVGLIQGATAIIIGAMIVAPLMTPILAFSLGVIWGDITLIKISISSIIKGVLSGILISAVIAYIVPLPSLSDEIISRVNPTLFDVLVAIASGIVGAYGYSNKRISNTIIGIAIAVALMPPLCVIGIGLGTFKLDIVKGAGILFLINLVSIGLAGAIVFWSMKIHPATAEREDVSKRALSQILVSLVILIAISIPIGIFMYSGYMVKEAQREIRESIKSRFSNQSIFSMDLKQVKNRYIIELVLTGDRIPDRDNLIDLKHTLLNYHPEIEDIRIRHFLSSSLVP